MDQKFNVIGVGTGCTDILYTKKGTIKFPGGSSANTIYALQKLGMKTAFIGKAGGDENGKIFLENMKGVGIDVSRLKILRGKTATCIVKVTPKRHKVLSFENWRSLSKLTKDDKELIRNAGAVFINLLDNVFEEVASFCTENGIRLFVSVGGYRSRKDPYALLKGHKVDVLFISTANIKKLKRYVKDILNSGTILVLTKGRDGCEVWKKNEYISYKGLTLNSVDPTGAGDAFAAGFVFGALKGWPIERVCDFANFMGAVATADYGARSRIATLEDYEIYKQSGLKKLIA